jgi:hypothetical protein
MGRSERTGVDARRKNQADAIIRAESDGAQLDEEE